LGNFVSIEIPLHVEFINTFMFIKLTKNIQLYFHFIPPNLLTHHLNFHIVIKTKNNFIN